MNDISREELERILAALGTGEGLKLRPQLEAMATQIAPDLQRLLEDDAFCEQLWQRYGKAKEGQKPQIEIEGQLVDAFEPISRDSFQMSLQSWAQALLLPLPQAQEEPLRTLLHEFHLARRRDLLSTTYSPRTGKREKREPSAQEKRWWNFLEACEDGDLEKVRAAVENGVLQANENGASAGLFSALVGGAAPTRHEVSSYLSEQGADIETDAHANKGTGLLHAASFDGEVETVHFLLEHGAKVDGIPFVWEEDENRESPNYCGLDETPLIAAAMSNHVEVMQALIAAGANVHAWCASHGSALDCATSSEAIGLLQAHGATPHYQTEG